MDAFKPESWHEIILETIRLYVWDLITTLHFLYNSYSIENNLLYHLDY